MENVKLRGKRLICSHFILIESHLNACKPGKFVWTARRTVKNQLEWNERALGLRVCCVCCMFIVRFGPERTNEKTKNKMQ